MKPSLLFTLGLSLVACGPDTRDGKTPGGGDDQPPGNDADPGTNDNCSAASKLIYTVDSNNTLSQFDPVAKTFHDLGTLDCAASSPLATPFSMGIDRDANAYVLYVDPGVSSEIFKVDTSTAALTCTPTAWTVQGNLEQFGMGFSTDTAGGTTDTLFIAGGPDNGGLPVTSVSIASVDVATMHATNKGTIQGSPELTGTGAAELWGFFPESNDPRVVKLDKSNGGAGTTFNGAKTASLKGEPSAWAFAFYGGDFFIFLEKDAETSTTVYQMNGMTGALAAPISTQGRRIVGAGVSTCAPTVIF